MSQNYISTSRCIFEANIRRQEDRIVEHGQSSACFDVHQVVMSELCEFSALLTRKYIQMLANTRLVNRLLPLFPGHFPLMSIICCFPIPGGRHTVCVFLTLALQVRLRTSSLHVAMKKNRSSRRGRSRLGSFFTYIKLSHLWKPHYLFFSILI